MLRAALGQLDRSSLTIGLLGAAVGALWALVLPLGMAATGVILPLATVLLAIRVRWFDIGLLMFANGLVPSIYYALFGWPAVPPAPVRVPGVSPTIPIEYLAPGAAIAFLIAGTAICLVVAFLEFSDLLRRQRAAAGEARIAQRTGGPSVS